MINADSFFLQKHRWLGISTEYQITKKIQYDLPNFTVKHTELELRISLSHLHIHDSTP